MPQRKQLTWTELRVGLFVLVGIVVLAVGVFYVTGGAGGFLGPKYRLRTYLPEVEGVSVGAAVRLDGVEIGNVDAIRINPLKPGEVPDPNRSIELVLRISRRYQDKIRADSIASLITEGLLGNRYVSIHRGFTGAVLKDNDEVPGQEEKAMKAIVQRGADLAENLNALSEQVREIVDGVQRGRGTLGKLLTDETAYVRLNDILGRLDQVLASVQAGQGSLGKVVTTDELYQKMTSAATRLDTVLGDVQAQKGTLGKIVYDSSLHDNAKQILEKGNALVSDVRAGKGTLGKLTTDETLYEKWRATGTNLETATAKLNSNQTTAGKFFSDPQFYDNLSGLAGDLRLLLGDFRQNPKKFLRVKFAIF
jgi:phospholipid/cholesterol/gamma-HCH transport system substrate-binding protein